jgi:hypothetical protein
LLLLGFSTAQGQSRINKKLVNQPKYDYKVLHFGFELGINYIDFNIDQIEDLHSVPGLYGIESVSQPGFTLLLISDLRLGHHLNLRFTPGISYTQRDMHFRLYDSQLGYYEKSKTVESTFIEFPLYLKFKSVRIGNGRSYVFGGAKYMIDMASQEKVDDPDLFRVKRHDFSYEVGWGVDIYFEYFKFSPQIKATFGVNDVLVYDGTIYTEGISALYTRAFMVSFCFE